MNPMSETCPEYIEDLIKEAVVMHISCIDKSLHNSRIPSDDTISGCYGTIYFSQFTLSKYSVIRSFTK